MNKYPDSYKCVGVALGEGARLDILCKLLCRLVGGKEVVQGRFGVVQLFYDNYKPGGKTPIVWLHD